jgi:hypothetical protein
VLPASAIECYGDCSPFFVLNLEVSKVPLTSLLGPNFMATFCHEIDILLVGLLYESLLRGPSYLPIPVVYFCFHLVIDWYGMDRYACWTCNVIF